MRFKRPLGNVLQHQASLWVDQAFSPVAINTRNYSTDITTPSDADVDSARKYCVNQLKHGDYEAYLIRNFLPRPAQDAYDALRTLNLELSRMPEAVSNPTLGRMRMQFWRDAISNTFDGRPPREPISMLLHRSTTRLKERAGPGRVGSFKFWLLRFLSTRERHLDNRPFANLSALEEYAENTYATLMYLTLASIPIQSVHMDHLSSHIGKACGIVAILRSIPVLTMPPRPVGNPSGSLVGSSRPPSLLLPLDVMAKVSLKEEDVFRQGPHADGLQDAVYQVATRANDHLITAREMLKNLQSGQGPGHDYEHQHEAEHAHTSTAQDTQGTVAEIRRGFGVLLEAVTAHSYLKSLESSNFDPWKARRSWRLPWSLWKAAKRREL